MAVRNYQCRYKIYTKKEIDEIISGISPSHSNWNVINNFDINDYVQCDEVNKVFKILHSFIITSLPNGQEIGRYTKGVDIPFNSFNNKSSYGYYIKVFRENNQLIFERFGFKYYDFDGVKLATHSRKETFSYDTSTNTIKINQSDTFGDANLSNLIFWGNGD